MTVSDEDAGSILQWVLLTHTPADGTFDIVNIVNNEGTSVT